MKKTPIFFLSMALLLGAVAACNPPLLGPKERQWLQTEVTGTVTLEDGTPVDSILISISGRRGGPALSSFKDTLLATTYSDPKGSFRFSQSMPTDYHFFVNAITVGNRSQYDIRACNGSGNPCDVVVGQKNTAQIILFKR